MHIAALFASLLFSFALFSQEPWLILYADKADPSLLQQYDLIIFDPDFHPPFNSLCREIKVFGRIDLSSMANVLPPLSLEEESQDEKEKYKNASLTFVNEIIEKTIPELLQLGFDGVYIDGMESLKKEQTYGAHELREAIIQTILLMKIHFPNIPIIVHAGYILLREIGFSIQGILENSVTTSHDSKSKKYALVNQEAKQKRAQQLQRAAHLYPNLKIFTLDFWDEKDRETIKKIYKIEEEYGFHPYVSNFKLNEIIIKP